MDAGYNVIGATLFFNFVDNENDPAGYTGDEAVENAREVCRMLGIQHHVIQSAKEFESAVLWPSWQEYKRGRTPSPCVLCNPLVKFKMILNFADSVGADFIATGHYAILKRGENPILKRGLYAKKDQTYFLFALTKEQLNRTLFPLGKMTKPEVRAIAKQLNLAIANRAESQDACFATSDGSFAEALRIRFNAPETSGRFILGDGTLKGAHRGIHNYTVGQRKGLGVALGKKAYVLGIDPVSSDIVLTTCEDDLKSKVLVAENISWTGGVVPSFPLRCMAQIRYKSPPAPAVVTGSSDNKLLVEFEMAQKAVTPGQAVVFYSGDIVLGGGWIKRAVG
jgi:tRNA-specific 2-thiouridylase